MLDDTDIMPFGKYKGELLQDVDSSYFHYLWTNGMKDKSDTDPIANYIKRNLSALKMENKDLIWS